MVLWYPLNMYTVTDADADAEPYMRYIRPVIGHEPCGIASCRLSGFRVDQDPPRDPNFDEHPSYGQHAMEPRSHAPRCEIVIRTM